MVQPMDGFSRYISRFKSDSNLTHTRIGDHKKIYGGKYSITKKAEKGFYNNYYKHVFINKQPEYLTEKQIEDGQILVDLDFRYSTDIEERRHTDEHINDLLELYIEEINKLSANLNDTFPIFVFQKDNINKQQDITKDGIHLIIGISMSNNIQMLLRKRVLDKIDDVLGDLPLENNYDSVLDRGISKGTTNWQLYGSRKPEHQPYILTHYYNIHPQNGEFEMTVTDLSCPKKNFINKLLPIISARNKKYSKILFIKMKL